MPARQEIELDVRMVSISNAGKVFFPESGFTKGEVLAYYAGISETILPHLRGRPLTLKRFSNGSRATSLWMGRWWLWTGKGSRRCRMDERGRIRHPKFAGMREDKVAAQVIRESCGSTLSERADPAST